MSPLMPMPQRGTYELEGHERPKLVAARNQTSVTAVVGLIRICKIIQ